jgi:hypothetical protein
MKNRLLTSVQLSSSKLVCLLLVAPLSLSLSKALAQVGYIGNGGYGNSSNIVSLTKPSGVVSGSLEIAIVSAQDSNGSATNTTPPSGWTNPTNCYSLGLKSANNTYTRTTILYHVAGSSEPSSYSFGGYNGTGTFIGRDGVIEAFSGASGIGACSEAYGASGSVTVGAPSGWTVGTWELYGFVDWNNAAEGTSSPALSNVYYNKGVENSYYVGALNPSSSPGNEVYSQSTLSTATTGIAASITPSGSSPASTAVNCTPEGTGSGNESFGPVPVAAGTVIFYCVVTPSGWYGSASGLASPFTTAASLTSSFNITLSTSVTSAGTDQPGTIQLTP